ncbi:MAG: type II 3-dehydroquinate dehydratase [Clostridiales bacterium]|nr:type II 3-dehydroquinate dehydratase [Clostridiales bacterium]
MKILVINGPNLNMLGIREKHLYGDKTYKALIELIKNHAKVKGVKVKCFQSNYEGALVTEIQKAYNKFDGIVINPGAYTHTSVAILDALKSVNIPTVEVHITEVNEREEFRKISFVKEYAVKTITGKGFDGYLEGINFLIDN